MPLIGDKDMIDRVVAFFKSLDEKEKIVKHFAISRLDPQKYRRVYAKTGVDMLRRPKEVCRITPFYNPGEYGKKNESGKRKKGVLQENAVHFFRLEKKGQWEDKGAMLEVSRWLGHERINVMTKYYI